MPNFNYYADSLQESYSKADTEIFKIKIHLQFLSIKTGKNQFRWWWQR